MCNVRLASAVILEGIGRSRQDSRCRRHQKPPSRCVDLPGRGVIALAEGVPNYLLDLSVVNSGRVSDEMLRPDDDDLDGASWWGGSVADPNLSNGCVRRASGIKANRDNMARWWSWSWCRRANLDVCFFRGMVRLTLNSDTGPSRICSRLPEFIWSISCEGDIVRMEMEASSPDETLPRVACAGRHDQEEAELFCFEMVNHGLHAAHEGRTYRLMEAFRGKWKVGEEKGGKGRRRTDRGRKIDRKKER